MDGWIILNCCMYRNRYGVVYCNKHAPVYISILLCYAPFPFLCDPPTSTCSHLYRTLLQTSAPFTHCSFLFVYWYLMTLCSSSVIKLPVAESSSSCVYRSRSISEVHQRGIYIPMAPSPTAVLYSFIHRCTYAPRCIYFSMAPFLSYANLGSRFVTINSRC